MNNKEPHPYKGSISVCLDCYKPKSDRLHQPFVSTDKLESRIANPGTKAPDEPVLLPTHSHTCEACNKTETHTNLECKLPTKVLCYSCSIIPGNMLHLAVEKTCGENLTPNHPVCHTDLKYNGLDMSGEIRASVIQTCPGHKCPGCQTTWCHDHVCNSTANGLCVDCAQQSTANIFRPSNIEQIAQTASTVLTGSEVSQLTSQYDAHIHSMCHGEDGTLKTDWQEIIHNHRRNLMQIMEKTRIHMMRTNKKTADYQMDECVNLTDEERADYEKSARRGRTIKETKAKTAKQPVIQAIDPAEAYQKLIKSLVGQVRSKRPGISDDEAVIRASKMADAMKAIEEEEGI